MPTSEQFWNRKSGRYDARLPTKGPNYAARIERVAAVCNPRSRVLDVGCATGEIALDLAARCGSVLGIDTAGDMIDHANTKAKQRGVTNAGFRAADPGDASLESGSFDVITCFSVLHLCEDYPAMLRRFHALLRPGGHVLCETPCLGDWGPWWRPVLWAMRAIGQAPAVRCIRVAELEERFRAVGFDILESAVHNPKSGQHAILARKH